MTVANGVSTRPLRAQQRAAEPPICSPWMQRPAVLWSFPSVGLSNAGGGRRQRERYCWLRRRLRGSCGGKNKFYAFFLDGKWAEGSAENSPLIWLLGQWCGPSGLRSASERSASAAEE